MTHELVRDVADNPREILFAEGRGVEPSGPPHSAWHATVCSNGGNALRQPHEVAQAAIRTKAHDEVNVVGQDRSAEYSDSGLPASACHGALDCSNGCLVEAPNSFPGVPRDVRIELKGSMVRHWNGYLCERDSD
jgi:hypothetical protein